MRARTGRILGMMICLLAAMGIGLGLVLFLGRPPAPIAATQPTTMIAATIPDATTAPATLPAPITVQTYGQVLHRYLLNYPETRPWAAGVDLEDAAHIMLKEPVYVCPRGDLWIKCPDADPLPQVLARAGDEMEHVVDRKIYFVNWSIDAKGQWQPSAVCPTSDGWELVSANQTQPIPWQHNYQWDWATNWDDNGQTRIAVPCDGGVDIITLGKQLTESYCNLCDGTGPFPRPHIVFDGRGRLAWCGAEEKINGTSHIARFVDGQWNVLGGDDWPGNVIQLVPMRDGSVMQVRAGADAGSVDLSIVQLESAPIDEQAVTALAEQLGDDDPAKRADAFEELTRYGPGIFPILEKLQADASPEELARIHELLDRRLEAHLGGMLVNENQMTLAARLPDEGAIFFLPEGVSIPRDQDDPLVVKPDYLVIRPSSAWQQAPAAIVSALGPNDHISRVRDEWIVTSADKGPERYLPPDQFDVLLRDSEKPFTDLVAIDRRGRWLFREPGAADGPTLLLDPTVPDPNPRLAIWQLAILDNAAWTADDWPSIKRGNENLKLTANGWEVMTDQPKTTTTTGPQSDGSWRVPDGNGHIFIIQPSGTITRLSANQAGTQPSVEAVFSKDVPSFSDIQRAWLDPAGRIDVVYGASQIAVIFPTGQIPPELSDQILPRDLFRIEPTEAPSTEP
ncbi:MAG: hypothetical protein ABSG31_16460 [Tepidisphaeraceae bacterium]